ncbi:hypothetical protein [Streptomyces sp. NBC_00083]|uniref:hypothetical protein n=1 Tax=Streptomyces sp. NBC_00083 TaxID=2975647 RepID=UPI002259BA82|nr:hypothetical protein [Streptomyces sp. NBC_00083]MCX5387675.1 hypothetical protein [Streptomyces sp. NBC_00083]
MRIEDWIRVEAHVPRPLAPEQGQELLAALAMADVFGLVDSSSDARNVRAGVNDRAPATIDTTREHDHEP